MMRVKINNFNFNEKWTLKPLFGQVSTHTAQVLISCQYLTDNDDISVIFFGLITSPKVTLHKCATREDTHARLFTRAVLDDAMSRNKLTTVGIRLKICV